MAPKSRKKINVRYFVEQLNNYVVGMYDKSLPTVFFMKRLNLEMNRICWNDMVSRLSDSDISKSYVSHEIPLDNPKFNYIPFSFLKHDETYTKDLEHSDVVQNLKNYGQAKDIPLDTIGKIYIIMTTPKSDFPEDYFSIALNSIFKTYISNSISENERDEVLIAISEKIYDLIIEALFVIMMMSTIEIIPFYYLISSEQRN